MALGKEWEVSQAERLFREEEGKEEKNLQYSNFLRGEGNFPPLPSGRERDTKIVLPKENRLSKKEVELVLKKGRTYRGFFLILKYWKNKLSSEDKRLSRFAVIVPLKVSKKATKRNRIKRLIRENLRKRLSQIRPGFDVVFWIWSSRYIHRVHLNRWLWKIVLVMSNPLNFLLANFGVKLIKLVVL